MFSFLADEIKGGEKSIMCIWVKTLLTKQKKAKHSPSFHGTAAYITSLSITKSATSIIILTSIVVTVKY